MREHEQTVFTRLLEDYCRSVGMGDFEIGPEGGLFELGDVEVVVRHDEDFDRLAMMSLVANIGAENLGNLAPELLHINAALNLSGGQAFSADIDNGDVQLQQSLPLNNLTPDDFDAALAAMAAKSRAARDLITTISEGPAKARELIEKAESNPSLMTFRP